MNEPEVRVEGVPIDDSQPEAAAAASPTGQADSDVEKTLEEKVIDALREIFDPEIPVNIYELGLIYNVDVNEDRNVIIKMTLTSPACPVAESLPGEVRARVSRLREVTECEVELVWEPQWSPDQMSEAAKLKLGML